MKRYLPLLLIACFLITIAIAGTTYLVGYAGRSAKEFARTITVYTTLPVEQAAILAQEYEKTTGVRVNIAPFTERELLNRLKDEASKPQADIILTNRTSLKEAKQNALLAPYESEYTDIIPDKFHDTEGYWTGVWHDPIIFAVNQDYLRTLTKEPVKWSELADGRSRLGMTDFLAAEAASNLLYTLVAANGLDQTLAYLKKIHPQIVQYAKFLATPARMASLGEIDIAIVVHSETMHYVQDGFPVKIIYPEDGTAYLLTGVGLVKGSYHGAEAKQFIDWLTQDGVQTVLAQHKFYFVPTNPETRTYQEYAAKHIKLLDHHDMYSPEQQHKLLDKWVQDVRLGMK